MAVVRAGLSVASSMTEMEKVLKEMPKLTSLDDIAGDVCEKAIGDRTASNIPFAVAFVEKLSPVRREGLVTAQCLRFSPYCRYARVSSASRFRDVQSDFAICKLTELTQ